MFHPLKPSTMAIPTTELANELTDSIDAEEAPGFARTLRAVDGQVFSGWRGKEGLFDERILSAAAQMTRCMAQLVAAHLRGQAVAIVFTGCGTSGRVAFLTARRYNALVEARDPTGRKGCFK